MSEKNKNNFIQRTNLSNNDKIYSKNCNNSKSSKTKIKNSDSREINFDNFFTSEKKNLDKKPENKIIENNNKEHLLKKEKTKKQTCKNKNIINNLNEDNITYQINSKNEKVKNYNISEKDMILNKSNNHKNYKNKNKDNNTKVYDETNNDEFENINNEDIDEKKENEVINKLPSNIIQKNKNYFINYNLDRNKNVFSEKTKKSNYNIDNNADYNEINDFTNTKKNKDNDKNKNKIDLENYISNNINKEKIKNRNLSCKVKKKKKISISSYDYASDAFREKDDIVLFENGIGVNDCFLNSIIQILFHLEEFKNKLFKLKINEDQKNPIFQLYTIFQNYRSLLKINSNETLNASLLRVSLHYRFKTYPKGKCGDPMETISEILDLIHNQYFKNSNSNNNFCQNELCPSHSNFLINLKEIKYCPNCKAKKLQLYDKDCFMYDVLSYEILSLVKNESFNEYKYSLFGKLKKLSQSFGDNKQKLEKCQCKEINTIKRLYLYNNFSPYLIINITWDSNFPKMGDICKIYGLIPIFDNNQNLFEIDFEKGKKAEKDLVTNYYLTGMILYGQNHYTCIFYNKTIEKWSFVDDENKKCFDTYNEIIFFLIKRRAIPVGIIFYCLKNFNLESVEKFSLNEEEFEKLYQKGLANDQRDIEEKENEEKIKNIKQEKINNKINQINKEAIKFENLKKQNSEEEIIKIKRNKKKVIS